MDLSTKDIAAVLGCPEANVSTNWPIIENAMIAICPGYSDNVAVAALSTVRVECPPFAPIREHGNNQYFVEHYYDNFHVRTMLGNESDVDAIRYVGRGFLQITGKANYKHFGDELGANLVDRPEEAMDPNVSAAIFALYFKERKCVEAANARKWELVRKLVNGGTNGLEQFLYYIAQLERKLYAAPVIG